MDANTGESSTNSSRAADLIQQLARKVVRLKLEAPAVFFLEMHLPVLSLAHASTLLAQPLLTPFFGAERIHTLTQILSDRKNVEALVERIRQLSDTSAHEGAR